MKYIEGVDIIRGLLQLKVAGHRVESKEILNTTYDKATILTKY